MSVKAKDLKYFSPLRTTEVGKSLLLHFLSYDIDILRNITLKIGGFAYLDNVIATIRLIFDSVRSFRVVRRWNFAKTFKQIARFCDLLSPALLSKAIQLSMGLAVRRTAMWAAVGVTHGGSLEKSPATSGSFPRTAASPSVPIRLSLAGSVV